MGVRIYTISKELGVTSKDLIARLAQMGVKVKSHSSSIEQEVAERLKAELLAPAKRPSKKTAKAAPAAGGARKAPPPPAVEKKEPAPVEAAKIRIPMPIDVRKLAGILNITPERLIGTLMKSGVMATINQNLDAETIEIIGHEFGRELEAVQEEAVPEAPPVEDEKDLVPRGAVVTLMGHIDHGKTSILDAIRKSRIVAKEAGGITQHIGAYEVTMKKGSITFLDTPGHETFTAMRARGANVTDIAVLVVASDDGVMPQTREAIDHARAANVPIVVAINKIDKSEASPDRVKQQLMELELAPEEYGGQTICCGVSATTREGLEHLLEMLVLQAEVMELRANPKAACRATVIEAEMDKARGALATVLVRRGTLRVGDPIVCGVYGGKVKALFDYRGKRVGHAGPAKPVEVLGLEAVPEPGDELIVVESEKDAKKLAAKRRLERGTTEEAVGGKMTLEELFSKIASGKVKELKLVIKGDTQGSIEALSDSLKKISSEKVGVKIIRCAVGDVNENDVMLASASDAVIIGYHTRVYLKAKELSRRERVEIKLYNVIYEAIDDVKKAMEGLLEPEIRESILGRAEVKQTFRASKGERIAGCYVVEGKVIENAKARLIREDKIIHETVLTSLRRFQNDVSEVKSGLECGIRLGGVKDIKGGDIIEIFKMEKIPQKL